MSTKGDRDAAIEALLRTSLRGGSGEGGCPSPDILAALVEGSLTNNERDTAEAHLASCERCQDALAALAAMPDLVPAVDQKKRRPWLSVRWLVPAAAALALLTVYAAVRPIGRVPARQTDVAASQPRVSVGLQANKAKGPEDAPSLMARAETPPAVPVAEALKQEKKAESTQRFGGRPPARTVAENAPSARPVAPAPAPAPPLPAEAGALAAVATPPPADAVQQKVPAGENRVQTELVTKATAAPSPTAAVASGGALRSSAPQMAKAAAAPSAADAKEQRLDALAESISIAGAGAWFVVTSRDGRAQWRVERTSVSRSTDNGLTWRPPQTVATAQLLAASSPNASTAWAVGRNGTVVRTVDGDRWTTCVFADKTDVVAIDAKDERTATVTTRDGRRFTTADGGITWVVVR